MAYYDDSSDGKMVRYSSTPSKAPTTKRTTVKAPAKKKTTVKPYVPPVRSSVPAPAAAPAYRPPGLNPEEQNYFDTTQRRVNQTYDMGVSQNQFQRSTAGADYAAKNYLEGVKWGRQYEALPGVYIRRGLGSSGIMQRGVNDFQTDRANAFAEMARAYQNQLSQLANGDAQLTSVRDQALGDLEAQKQARLALLASMLNGG